MSSGDQVDLARWIVRLSAKGEASTRGGDLRRLALVTCAKGVAEVQLYRQQSRVRFARSSQQPRALKRMHAEGMRVEPAASGAFAATCHCRTCNLCSNYQAAGANSCYCKALGYVTGVVTDSKPRDGTHCPPSSPTRSSSFDEDEESKLIDDFLSSLDGVPSKKCKRTVI